MYAKLTARIEAYRVAVRDPADLPRAQNNIKRLVDVVNEKVLDMCHLLLKSFRLCELSTIPIYIVIAHETVAVDDKAVSMIDYIVCEKVCDNGM